jgi:hypothetical protein
MVVLKNSVVIGCKPEDAFDYLSDHRSELEWNPACREMQKITEGPVGLGTKYRAKWSNSPVVELETKAYERPRTWTMHNGGPIEVTLRCTLETVAEGTRLTTDFAPTPHGWFRVMFPVFVLVLRRQEKQNMRLIKSALERRVEMGRA